MTLGELIEKLENLKDEMGEDTEVRLAQQPNYPMQHAVGRIRISGTRIYIDEGRWIMYGDGREDDRDED